MNHAPSTLQLPAPLGRPRTSGAAASAASRAQQLRLRAMKHQQHVGRTQGALLGVLAQLTNRFGARRASECLLSYDSSPPFSYNTVHARSPVTELTVALQFQVPLRSLFEVLPALLFACRAR